VKQFTGFLLLSLLSAGPLRAGVHVKGIDSVALTVQDMDTAIDFYTGALTFNKISDTEISGHDAVRLFGLKDARVRVVRLQLGDEALELRQFLNQPGSPYPSATHSNDHWFQHVAIAVSDMGAAVDAVERRHVDAISLAPQKIPDWNIQLGGVRLFLFKDPDGHPLEFIWYPDGKGNAKWHRFGPDLFMGIDHTAIVVASTPQSLSYYRDELGLSVVGEADSSGIEQERLTYVSGANVHITTLRADEGFNLQLIDYIAPLDGRPLPAEMPLIDDVFTQTQFLTDGVPADQSPAAHDPDGHPIMFVSR
jgi:catechol 2,3-dioxygenase-like lactoylglutathione lyase family enzyme